DRPPVGAGAPLLHSRNGSRCQVTEQVVRAERLPEGQPKREGARGRRRRGGDIRNTSASALSVGVIASAARGSRAQLRRRQGEDLLDRVVERANAAEPCSEGD